MKLLGRFALFCALSLVSLSKNSIKVRVKNLGGINPLFFNSSASSIFSSIYDPLLRIDEEGHFVKCAASHIRCEGRKIIFYIDSKFNDGSNVEAKDFADSLKLILEESNFAEKYFLIENAELYSKGKVPFDRVGVRTKGRELTIILKYEVEDPILVYGSLFSFPLFVPFVNGKYNGPFIPDSVAEDSIMLKKNPFYEATQIDEIEFISVKDSFVAVNMFRNGELDVVLNLLPIEDLNYREYSTNFKTFFVGVNTSTVSQELRQLISSSVDREEVCNLIGYGYQPAYSFVPKEYQGFNNRINMEKKGESVQKSRKLRLLCSRGTISLTVARYLKSSLSKIGLDIEIVTLPIFVKNRKLASGDFDLYLSIWAVDNLSLPFDFLSIFVSGSKDNYFKFISHDFDILVRKAYSSYSTGEKRDLLSKAEEEILQSLPVIPLFFPKSFYLIKDSIKGVKIVSGASGPDFRFAFIK